jgi:hypothetical protein
MSNAAEHRDSVKPVNAAANPYELRFRLPEHEGQLAGWVAQIDQPPTAEDLPSTADLRDLLEGKVRTPEEQRARWGRLLILLLVLTAALYWLFLVRRYLLDIISLG